MNRVLSNKKAVFIFLLPALFMLLDRVICATTFGMRPKKSAEVKQ